MKTRENRAMRFASVLLVLTLLATSLTAGTFAKYTTDAKGEGKARVAKFGVDVEVDATNVFGTKYKNETKGNGVTSDDTDITVQAQEMVVAPGTNGSMTFSISGNPETSVKLEVKLENIKEIMLASGTYRKGENGTQATVNDEGYDPVQWTLKKDSTIVEANNVKYENTTLVNINKYFTEISENPYAPNSLENTVGGNYILSWEWKYDNANDDADTILGDLAVNHNIIGRDPQKGQNYVTVTDADYELEEAFDFSISVTQVD